MARIIDSRPLLDAFLGVLRPLSGRVAQAVGRTPGLAILRAVENAGSAAYAARIRAAAAQAGIACHEVPVAARTDGAAGVRAQVSALSAAPDIDGILILLPLPAGLAMPRAMACMDPDRDVDCQHPLNLGRLMTGNPLYLPCTATAAVTLAEGMLRDLRGMNCAVIGASASVGRPLALQLLDRGATVDVLHIQTRDIAAHARRAQVVFAAAGHAGLVDATWVSPGAVLVDIGINADPSGRPGVVGDIDAAAVADHAAAVTAVPDGVGPMTTGFLLANTVHAASRRAGLDFTIPDLTTLPAWQALRL
ncbi:protein folD [Gluconacetobacter sp. SXCC-1]|uniref:Bifunctional protein FolD n=1 Tax=Komagataeibacter rhaeticus TaxID=215221 RepID=A0A181CAN2_9PROT|nr:tetrahydrofolate dehydrogenase/cyclohydrolase catalytic domain-containing protein [Komagataeibacter rhaeticus]ATU72782.1 methylenetetrahydrofolate dehydrogenase [Komagataeibacter xylinus]EGG76506.1 protein folD [Gluconacetobacter sp. SXCC-1]QIP35411.1 bifunctional 5,10-methylenetetrahydrofolate dehydrogenase/5,10-methenyltetrahydrofolate cyclohydrolase [Komagataeibacter rhaeticus]QOC47981.1 bifunctional 5,10-methylenetetrahydrofolate dehydrogenase/5,10-methenyltetrahydrofolate cyclohydrolase